MFYCLTHEIYKSFTLILLILHKGFDSSGSKACKPGEIEVFDMNSKQWKSKITCGQEPMLDPGTTIHAMESLEKLIVVSGNEPSRNGYFNRIDILDIAKEPLSWSTIDFDYFGDWTMIPGIRNNFSAVFNPPSMSLYIFGGGKEKSRFTDLSHCMSLIVINFSTIWDEE